MTAPYRVLVLSDLHAVIGERAERSKSLMNYAHGSAPRGLLSLCHRAVLDHFPDGVDLVVAGGDLADKADSGALVAVWADLNWLADEFGAPLVATAGNHDFDSRPSTNPLPYKTLLGLKPVFPFGTTVDRNKYFTEHHAVFADDRVVVVTANSAGHHGYVGEGAPEHEHGRHGEHVSELIGESLDSLNELPPVKLFLTHHHLNQLPDFDVEERSASIGHEAVLRKLGEYGSWVVVHGHKHRGWIQYASGSGDSPPLISASSLSADFGEGTFAEKVRHQFHILEIPLEEDAVLRADGITGARGSITSWTHSPLGWRIAAADEDLPGVSGFGWKTNLEGLAMRLSAQIQTERFMNWGELVAFEPRLTYLTFDDLKRLVGWMSKTTPRLEATIDVEGRLSEVALAKVLP